MNTNKLATIAYETYAETLDDELLAWDDLTSDERKAWRAVVAELQNILAEEDDDAEHGSLFGGDEDDDA